MSYKIKGEVEVQTGFGLPRHTTTTRTAYTPPSKGYKVFDTDLNKEFTWDGAAWVGSSDGTDKVSKSGDTMTGPLVIDETNITLETNSVGPVESRLIFTEDSVSTGYFGANTLEQGIELNVIGKDLTITTDTGGVYVNVNGFYLDTEYGNNNDIDFWSGNDINLDTPNVNQVKINAGKLYMENTGIVVDGIAGDGVKIHDSNSATFYKTANGVFTGRKVVVNDTGIQLQSDATDGDAILRFTMVDPASGPAPGVEWRDNTSGLLANITYDAAGNEELIISRGANTFKVDIDTITAGSKISSPTTSIATLDAPDNDRTLVTKEWVLDKAGVDLSNYVTLDGDETITGVKTIVNDTFIVQGTSPNVSGVNMIEVDGYAGAGNSNVKLRSARIAADPFFRANNSQVEVGPFYANMTSTNDTEDGLASVSVNSGSPSGGRVTFQAAINPTTVATRWQSNVNIEQDNIELYVNAPTEVSADYARFELVTDGIKFSKSDTSFISSTSEFTSVIGAQSIFEYSGTTGGQFDFGVKATSPVTLDTDDDDVLTTKLWVETTIADEIVAAGGVVSIDDLSDVDITTVAPTNGQILVWSTDKFIPGDDAAAGGSIGDLSDVDITTAAPATNDILVFDGTNFVPGATNLTDYVGLTGDETIYGFKSFRDTEFAVYNQANNVKAIELNISGDVYIKSGVQTSGLGQYRAAPSGLYMVGKTNSTNRQNNLNIDSDDGGINMGCNLSAGASTTWTNSGLIVHDDSIRLTSQVGITGNEASSVELIFGAFEFDSPTTTTNLLIDGNNDVFSLTVATQALMDYSTLTGSQLDFGVKATSPVTVDGDDDDVLTTKAWVIGKLPDNTDYVDLISTQEISGQKTFKHATADTNVIIDSATGFNPSLDLLLQGNPAYRTGIEFTYAVHRWTHTFSGTDTELKLSNDYIISNKNIRAPDPTNGNDLTTKVYVDYGIQPFYLLVEGTGSALYTLPYPYQWATSLDANQTNNQVFVNGIKQVQGSDKAYTITTGTFPSVTFTAGNEPAIGDDVEIYLFGVTYS